MNKINPIIAKKLAPIFKKNKVYVLVSNPSNYSKINNHILSYYTNEQKVAGIYVTLNKKYKQLSKELKGDGINTSLIYFIDGITKKSKENIDNCTFISAPEALTELSLAITTLADTNKFKFLFFDSINTLLLYNNEKNAEKFSHHIINIIKEAQIGGIIFSLKEGSNDNVLSMISQFADSTISI